MYGPLSVIIVSGIPNREKKSLDSGFFDWTCVINVQPCPRSGRPTPGLQRS